MPSLLNPYVLLGLLVGAVCIFGSGVYTGYGWADRKAEIAALEQGVRQRDAVIAEQQRQAEAGRAIAEADAARKQRDDSEAADSNKQVESYVATLPPPRPGDVCGFTPDDLRLLNNLANHLRGSPLDTPATDRH